MRMLFKDITTRKQFTKDSQSFWLDFELERDGGGVQHYVMNFRKGVKAVGVAEGLEHLAQQVREA